MTTRLRKNITTTIIPGNPGVPTTAGSPYKPAYSLTSEVYVTTWRDHITKEVVAVWESSSLEGASAWWSGVGPPLGDPTVTTRTVTTYYPAVAAVPGSAGVPPTATQILQSLNHGWNSHARSVNPIPAGNFIQYAVAPGVMGAFLGLGQRGMEGRGPHLFRHGLLVDHSGVWVFESGVKVKRIRTAHLGTSRLRIVRQPDNSVVYLISTGSETIAHTSGEKASILPLYGYGLLYMGNDTMRNAEITSGKVQYGRA